jgi:hypothetical protein
VLWVEGCGKLELLEGSGDVVGHGNVNVAAGLVPVKSEATVE